MRARGAPLAYAAPKILPTLVPARCEMGTLFSSKTCRTPRCAKPRAKPPPRASRTPACLGVRAEVVRGPGAGFVMSRGSQGRYPQNLGAGVLQRQYFRTSTED